MHFVASSPASDAQPTPLNAALREPHRVNGAVRGVPRHVPRNGPQGAAGAPPLERWNMNMWQQWRAGDTK